MLLTVSLGILFLAVPVWSGDPRALGNLAVVIKNTQLISTPDNPAKAQTGDLWCQASVDNTIAQVTWGRFTRFNDLKIYNATVDENGLKARLIFGEALATEAGKYRCELRTASGDVVHGNMFALTRPIIVSNGSREYKISEHDPTLIEGEDYPVTAGASVEITCPVFSYPLPNIIWFKDGLPIEEGERYKFGKKSIILDKVEENDAGKYRCVATNQFSSVVDGPEQQYELKLDQNVYLAGYHGWILPLIIILIILLLVFICIYAWQACSRYNSANYNVARREQNLRREREEEQRRLTKETP